MLKIGIKGRQETVVSDSNIATNVGSGKVEVFATPMMIALIEKTASLSIQPFLEDGQSSVGTQVNVSHCSATPLGMNVYAESEVIEVDRRRVLFKVAAYDERGLIGEGTHERFIIDIARFTEKTYSK